MWIWASSPKTPRNSGYSAVFVSDHGGASSFQINTLNANRMAFEDTYTRWDMGTFGSLATTLNELVAAPVKTGAAALHLKSTSPAYGETFVYTGRGPNLRAGDATLTVSVYPTRIDAGSGLYVSAAVGGDPSILGTPWGYTTAGGTVSPGKSVVFVWQLGTPRASSTAPDARVQTYDLGAYTLNQWNTYTINISQVVEQYFQAHPADRPLDYNGLVHLKMAAAAGAGGTAEGYFDSYTVQDPTPPNPADEFAYRNGAARIGAFNTAAFKLFGSAELGQTRHTQRFNFASTNPADFTLYNLGSDGIPLIHQLGYPAQFNHPGTTVTVTDTVQNTAYNADFVETRDPDYRDAWDQMLTNGYLILGHWTSDSHTGGGGTGRPATTVYAPALEFDPLIKSIYEGRSYSAVASFGGRIIYNRDTTSLEPYAARYPVYVSNTAASAGVHLNVTGGLAATDVIRWVQNNATLASQGVGGASFDAVQTVPLPGSYTYVRAEILRSDGSPRGMTQPIFFQDVGGLPADMSFNVERTATPDSIHYNHVDTRGITSAGWDANNTVLALALVNPEGSLVELRLTAGQSTPVALYVDGGAAAASSSLGSYQAATTSAWFFDTARRTLYFKVRHAAAGAQVQVSFGSAGAPPTFTPTAAPTFTPTPTSTPMPTAPAPGSAITLSPSADAYVDAANPAVNYGKNNALRTDTSPDQRSYLRFAVPPNLGTIGSATLRIYANTTSAAGFRLARAEGGWAESSVSFNNKPPAAGGIVGTSGTLGAGTWVEVNVLDALAAVGGSGELNLVIDTTSTTGVHYDSREGPNPPQLIIRTGTQSAPTVTPSPGGATTLTFAPIADAYISESSPATNYGLALNLRVDSSAPKQASYLRFDIQGVEGTVTRATLRVFAASGSTAGYEVRTVQGTWAETAVTHNNGPAVGATAAGVSNKPFTTGTWTSVDVTSLVRGSGLLDLAMAPLSSTAINFNSRQGANPPQLVVEFGGSALAATEPLIAAPQLFDLPPDSLDTDGDGAPDAVELLSDGSPIVADTDGDGLLDLWEIENGLSPADPDSGDGAEGDPDGDGIANIDEQRNGTDPLNWDGIAFIAGPHPLFLPLVSSQ